MSTKNKRNIAEWRDTEADALDKTWRRSNKTRKTSGSQREQCARILAAG